MPPASLPTLPSFGPKRSCSSRESPAPCAPAIALALVAQFLRQNALGVVANERKARRLAFEVAHVAAALSVEHRAVFA